MIIKSAQTHKTGLDFAHSRRAEPVVIDHHGA